MHQHYSDFLQNQLNATLKTTPSGIDIHFASEEEPPAKKQIFPVTHLGICEVQGQDAAGFLQGQVTCNINEVNTKASRFAALCNPKGRVISPLLILKSADAPDSFFLLMPGDLTEKVIQHLSIFILRADVRLQNRSEQYCLSGISRQEPVSPDNPLPRKPFETFCQDLTFIRLPGNRNRHLILAPAVKTIDFWQSSLANDFSPADSALWRFQDLSAGLPWFSADQSAQYIPQMINTDKLNGISFNKGCYTGQEIVARTHYLGKNKREMFLAECEKTTILNTEDAHVIESNSRQVIGKLLSFQCIENSCRCLLVMPPEYSRSASLTLASEGPAPLTIIPFE